jgi:spore coat polysaccharide biosynthesis predicted glycosyltransferase SpsG
MPDLMAEADISIGGAGATAWERCLLGLPSIVVIMAQNQLGIANYLVDKGSIILSSSDNVEILAHVKKIATYGAKRLQITKNSLRVCDGKGISRILNEIQKIIPNDPL